MPFRGHSLFLLSLCALCALRGETLADPLPGTKPLTEPGDLARKMVDGLHAYLDRETAASVEKRQARWRLDLSSADAYRKSVQPNRDRLRTLLGVTDPRLPPRLEFVGGPDEPSLVAAGDKYAVRAVRWAVLPGVDGEGLLLEPKGDPVADVVAVPDAGQTPEQVAGLAAGLVAEAQFARRLAEAGCRVLVPVVIDRDDAHSGSARFDRWTNQPHREFVHRMAFEMGRTTVGYEVQKVLAGVDWFARKKDHPPVGVFGYGEGGRIALYAAALDERIAAVVVSGSFGPREGTHAEPLDRNLWGLLAEFGDGELLRLVWPRSAIVEWSRFVVAGPKPAKPGRAGAAPGTLENATALAVNAEMGRTLEPLVEGWKGGPRKTSHLVGGVIVGGGASFRGPGIPGTYKHFLADLTDKEVAVPAPGGDPPADRRKGFDPAARHKRQFDQLVGHTQRLWRDSGYVRDAFWKDADATTPAAWDRSCDKYREHLYAKVIGRLPPPTEPTNPRTRRVYDEPAFTGYEVTLDLYPDVFASGILLLPKDVKPGEKRPVVVCQHGLEGRPRDCIDPEKTPVYDRFARKLVEKGYVVYCPQNPYIGDNHFRQVQRKANPLGLSLFSFITRQHERTLDWLCALPQVDPDRIGFYGLSYGGKTAVRVPALEKRYKAVVCAGDFNEWIGKVASVELRAAYPFTKEYEIGEFDLGHTFNYAELAALIAPRAFMVERGHDDGVGIDPWVAAEYAKVRYLYANRLKLPDRTAIEFSVGGHRNFCRGSFEFLDRHLGPVRR